MFGRGTIAQTLGNVNTQQICYANHGYQISHIDAEKDDPYLIVSEIKPLINQTFFDYLAARPQFNFMREVISHNYNSKTCLGYFPSNSQQDLMRFSYVIPQAIATYYMSAMASAPLRRVAASDVLNVVVSSAQEFPLLLLETSENLRAIFKHIEYIENFKDNFHLNALIKSSLLANALALQMWLSIYHKRLLQDSLATRLPSLIFRLMLDIDANACITLERDINQHQLLDMKDLLVFIASTANKNFFPYELNYSLSYAGNDSLVQALLRQKKYLQNTLMKLSKINYHSLTPHEKQIYQQGMNRLIKKFQQDKIDSSIHTLGLNLGFLKMLNEFSGNYYGYILLASSVLTAETVFSTYYKKYAYSSENYLLFIAPIMIVSIKALTNNFNYLQDFFSSNTAILIQRYEEIQLCNKLNYYLPAFLRLRQSEQSLDYWNQSANHVVPMRQFFKNLIIQSGLAENNIATCLLLAGLWLDNSFKSVRNQYLLGDSAVGAMVALLEPIIFLNVMSYLLKLACNLDNAIINSRTRIERCESRNSSRTNVLLRLADLVETTDRDYLRVTSNSPRFWRSQGANVLTSKTNSKPLIESIDDEEKINTTALIRR